jgi:uncharacterized protein
MPPARPRALVTGASSGIGEALCERLAADGYDLVAVARRRERLEALASRLRETPGAAVEVLVADLTEPADLRRVEQRAAADDRLALLVNNAGFGGYGPFAQAAPETIANLIALHVTAPVVLCRAAAPGMIARGRGALINVASLLALSGPLPAGRMPSRATYAGAKSFLLTFTQALATELQGSGVRALVCLPGMVATEFHGIGATYPPGLPVMDAAGVAQAIVAGLAGGEVVCVPGLEDTAVLERLRELQQVTLAGGNKVEIATRYR